MEFSHRGISSSIPCQNSNKSQPKPLLASPSPFSTLPPPNPVSFQATPVLSIDRCGSCGSTVALIMDHPHSDSSPSSDLDMNFDTHPRSFSHHRPKSADPDFSQDGILDRCAPNCRSPQDSAKESLKHDQTLLAQYIQSNSKLTAQLAFMKSQRTKKHTDSDLVSGYRFIVSLHQALKVMVFKDAPHQHISSRAILAYLDVTPSWLSRAKQVIKLLDKLGPEGTSPDPLVIKRLQSKVVIRKGSDLLTFLKQQDCNRQSTCNSAVATV